MKFDVYINNKENVTVALSKIEFARSFVCGPHKYK